MTTRNVVTLYLAEPKNYGCVHFTMSPQPDEPETEHWYTAGRYVLPEGYRVGVSIAGEQIIYDPDGVYCDIVVRSDRRPAVQSTGRHATTLVDDHDA